MDTMDEMDMIARLRRFLETPDAGFGAGAPRPGSCADAALRTPATKTTASRPMRFIRIPDRPQRPSSQSPLFATPIDFDSVFV